MSGTCWEKQLPPASLFLSPVFCCYRRLLLLASEHVACQDDIMQGSAECRTTTVEHCDATHSEIAHIFSAWAAEVVVALDKLRQHQHQQRLSYYRRTWSLARELPITRWVVDYGPAAILLPFACYCSLLLFLFHFLLALRSPPPSPAHLSRHK